jgi:polar amino acid transport system substrate-binding protein
MACASVSIIEVKLTFGGEFPMKRLRLFSALLLSITVLGLLAGCAQPAQQGGAGKKFVFASDATFPPMDLVDKDKNIVGFDMDMIAAIAKDQGFQAEIKNTAWDGIFAGLEGGAYDAVLSAVSITDERKKTYDFSDPYLLSGQAVIVRSDETAIKGKNDLTGKKVGAQIGTTGADEVKNIQGVTAKTYDTIDLAMMDLANGQVDAVVVDYPVASNYALVSPQFKGKLQIVGDRFTNEPYGLTVQKGDPKKLLPLFNQGLKDIKANGTYNQIYAKWIGGTPPAQ